MHLDVHGLPFWTPFAATVLIIPDLFLLLRIYGNCRLPAVQKFRRLRANVLKLRVTVRMRRTLLCLSVRLQAVLLLVQ